jgi:predicted  nucleic acid-binding Zn ribbon protein
MNSTELNETSVVNSAAPVADSSAAAVADVENVAAVMPVMSDDSAAVAAVVAAAVAVTVAVDDADASEEEDDVLAIPVYIDEEEQAMSSVAIRQWTKYYKNDDDMKLLRRYIPDKYLHTTDKALKKSDNLLQRHLLLLCSKKMKWLLFRTYKAIYFDGGRKFDTICRFLVRQ